MARRIPLAGTKRYIENIAFAKGLEYFFHATTQAR
jgi:hypothetical protein